MEIKARIEEKGLKMNWIAKKLGISAPLLSMYLSKERRMPDSVEIKLKELVG